MNKAKKAVYIIIGTLALIAGSIGIFVPGLPTTPLYLLALWAYSHSWIALHNQLVENKMIRKYVNPKGVSPASKLISILIMLTMVSFSVVLYWNKYPYLAYSLIGVGGIGLVFMIKHIKIKDKE